MIMKQPSSGGLFPHFCFTFYVYSTLLRLRSNSFFSLEPSPEVHLQDLLTYRGGGDIDGRRFGCWRPLVLRADCSVAAGRRNTAGGGGETDATRRERRRRRRPRCGSGDGVGDGEREAIGDRDRERGDALIERRELLERLRERESCWSLCIREI